MIRKITLMFGLVLLVAAVGYSQTPGPGGQGPNTSSPNSPQGGQDATRPSTQTPSSTQGQGAGQGQSTTPGQSSRTGTQSASTAGEKTFEGRLTKVDTSAKTITVAALTPKEGNNNDMTFKYNDSTVVTGGERSVQALAGKTGSTLKITYEPDRENSSTNMASKIEIDDNKK